MIEIFNGIKGKWESIPATGLPYGYTIEIFVPARKSGKKPVYRAKRGMHVVSVEYTEDLAIIKAKHDAVDQRRKQNNEPDDEVGTPKLI